MVGKGRCSQRSRMLRNLVCHLLCKRAPLFKDLFFLIAHGLFALGYLLVLLVEFFNPLLHRSNGLILLHHLEPVSFLDLVLCLRTDFGKALLNACLYR